jgi:prepilin-type N-terminal cleavage/methylation domain-containing protein
MSQTRTSGFTLVEMAVTILVLGLLFSFSIPAFQSIGASYQLHGATENLAAQLRIAREKAMSLQMEQPMHLAPGSLNADYHIHYMPGGFCPTTARWKFPRGITYHSIASTSPTPSLPIMLKDGRINGSGTIILRDMRGNQDTVSYLSSGLVLVK